MHVPVLHSLYIVISMYQEYLYTKKVLVESTRESLITSFKTILSIHTYETQKLYSKLNFAIFIYVMHFKEIKTQLHLNQSL